MSAVRRVSVVCAVLSVLCVSARAAGILNECRASGMFAMSFDNGPSDNTPQLLNILKEKGVKVTFHFSAKYLTDPNIQAIVQRTAAEGHLIGMVPDSQMNLMAMTDAQIKATFSRLANVFRSFIGYAPRFLRLAYKSYDDRVRLALESIGMIISQHNLESYDYNYPGDRILSAMELAINLAGDGAATFLSVQRDSMLQSVSVTGRLVDMIRSHAYRIVRMDECAGVGDATANKDPIAGGAGGNSTMPAASPVGGAGSIGGGAGSIPGSSASPVDVAGGAGAPDADSGPSPSSGLQAQGSGAGPAASAGYLAVAALSILAMATLL